MTRSLRTIGIALCTFTFACDSPMIPGRDVGDVYPFRLETTPPLVLRWPTGSHVRVFIAAGTNDARTALLENAFRAGAAAWNEVALFGEFRIERTSRIEDADVVLTWSDVIPPVDTDDCRPAVTQAVTTFCIDGIGTAAASVRTFPLRPPADPGSSRVELLVTVLAAESANPATVHRLVAHELGHVLGIATHSGDARDLMFRTDPALDRPGPRDQATIQILYHTAGDILF